MTEGIAQISADDDRRLAEAVREAAKDLNAHIANASKAGLVVEVDTHALNFGISAQKTSSSHVEVKVSRPL